MANLLDLPAEVRREILFHLFNLKSGRALESYQIEHLGLVAKKYPIFRTSLQLRIEAASILYSSINWLFTVWYTVKGGPRIAKDVLSMLTSLQQCNLLQFIWRINLIVLTRNSGGPTGFHLDVGQFSLKIPWQIRRSMPQICSLLSQVRHLELDWIDNAFENVMAQQDRDLLQSLGGIPSLRTFELRRFVINSVQSCENPRAAAKKCREDLMKRLKQALTVNDARPQPVLLAYTGSSAYPDNLPTVK